MRYYLIAGEASGDLHAAHLMQALAQHDAQAQFRGIGGEAMQEQGLHLHCHYRHLAHMGLWQVLRHLPSLLRLLREVKRDLRAFRPDVVVLIDAPGFNLRIARWVNRERIAPVAYYILPKTWATRSSRNAQLQAHTQLRLSILPFEEHYFSAQGIDTHYVGNPTHSQVQHFLAHYKESPSHFCRRHQLDTQRPLVALLPGSRTAEIRANLPRMLQALALADPHGHFQAVVAQAPGQEDTIYKEYARESPRSFALLRGENFPLLHHAHTALVTSGTATLETALLGTPQIVCYHLRGGRLVHWLRPYVLHCPYISLVNLIAQQPIVPELIGPDTQPHCIAQHLEPLLSPEAPSSARKAQLQALAQLPQILGSPEAASLAAQHIGRLLEARS